MHFMVFTKSLTTEVMCRFVGRLASHFAIRPTSGSTDTTHPDGVELRFLSRYSPELLPDKLVNADLKHRLPDHHRSPGPVQLAAETRRSCYAYKSSMPPFRYHALSTRA